MKSKSWLAIEKIANPTMSNKLLQRDALIASFSSIFLAIRLDAVRSARLNSGVSRFYALLLVQHGTTHEDTNTPHLGSHIAPYSPRH
jgi:hypothetical protein